MFSKIIGLFAIIDVVVYSADCNGVNLNVAIDVGVNIAIVVPSDHCMGC